MCVRRTDRRPIVFIRGRRKKSLSFAGTKYVSAFIIVHKPDNEHISIYVQLKKNTFEVKYMAHEENRVEKQKSVEMLPSLRGQELYRNIHLIPSPIIIYFPNIILLHRCRRYQK